MVYYIIAGFLLLIVIIFFITGKLMDRSHEYFERNMKSGLAEVVGYDRLNDSTWYSLKVKLQEVDTDKYYVCASRKINKADYPAGTIVRVLYAPKKIVGISLYEVHLNEEGKSPIAEDRLGRVFVTISIVCFMIAAALCLLGLFL